MTALKWIVFLAVVGWGGIVALAYVAQRSLMYFPEKVRTPPAAAGVPEAQEIVLQTGDGEKLIAWHVPPRGEKPVVLRNTFTPDLYVQYFSDLRDMIARGQQLTPEATIQVMSKYATVPATDFA